MYGNVKLYFLLFVQFLIYTAFLYIQNSTINNFFKKNQSNVTNNILIAIEGVSVLLGGISAAFVIPAIYLVTISLLSLLIGISIFEVLFDILDYNSQFCFLIALISFSVFAGLFRFLFLVIILDQNDSKFVERKIYGWFIMINISYVFVYIILPSPNEKNYSITIYFVAAVTGIILFIIGSYWKLFVIDSEIINIFQVIKGFRGQRISIESPNSLDDKNAIIPISTSVIFFILLIPIGICDSQTRYAYLYQSHYFKISTDRIEKLWFMIFSPISVIIISSILLCVEIFNFQNFQKILSNVKYNIIVGIILLIISSVLSGVVEYVRLQMFHNWNKHTGNPYGCTLNQTIGGKTYNASCLPVFIMIPQNVINGVGEILILSTCVKYLYKQSKKSIKYLSISLILAAIGSGGLSDIFFIVLPYADGFNVDHLNDMSNYRYRLDYIYYFLGGIALLSLIIGIILMNRFPKYFPEDSVQNTLINNDGSSEISIIHNGDNC